MNKIFIFDTHCHLADEKYEKNNTDVNIIIEKAKKEGVNYIINVGYDKKTNEKSLNQSKQFSNLFVALGLHPNSTKDLKEENLKWIEEQLINKKVIAIGEIGLDYYRTSTEKEIQRYWFKKQLELAKKYELPVCLHIREAFEDAYKIVKETGVNKGILHCYTGNWETAQKFINLGNFYISFAGNITYKNGKWQERLQKVVENVPLEKIMIETDAPYLTPEIFRGEINYPQYIIYTLSKIAEIKNKEVSEIWKIIYSNSLSLFNLS